MAYAVGPVEQKAILDLARQIQEESWGTDTESECSDDGSDYEGSDGDAPYMSECPHQKTIEKNGSFVCTECGNILSAVMYDQEAFAECGGSSRHHHRKFEERGILRELEKCNFPRAIKIGADFSDNVSRLSLSHPSLSDSHFSHPASPLVKCSVSLNRTIPSFNPSNGVLIFSDTLAIFNDKSFGLGALIPASLRREG